MVRRVVVPVPTGAEDDNRDHRLDPRRVLITVALNVLAISYIGYQLHTQGTTRQILHVIDVYNPYSTNCGLLSAKDYLITSDNIVSGYVNGPGFGTPDSHRHWEAG